MIAVARDNYPPEIVLHAIWWFIVGVGVILTVVGIVVCIVQFSEWLGKRR